MSVSISRSFASRRYGAEAILREAGKRAMESFRTQQFSVEKKGMQDFVSEVDRQTENFIRDSLLDLFPDDGFLGEESGGEIASTTWIVDPIDGTTNFVRGIPVWCLSAGFVVDGKPVVGVVYDPCRDEMFSAHSGGGAWLNGTKITVSTTDDPKESILSVGFNFKAPVGRHQSIMDGLFTAGAMHRMHGSGALGLAYVAAGRVDGFWEAYIHSWDVAAGLVLVHEAGGYISDFLADGDLRNGKEILASAPGMKAFFGALTGDI
ncbi:inositol monophosphatase family protein [Thalassospira alkalitolerans]|uniref:inositol monophosphatase family protein n=1 Tax=Thalassospira alkalitolerans TaxID=1293890 RepID=UPI0030EF1C0F|tara:strand:+ start:68228 stop:69016 length:789 start_codon:yes stop_codon:yes gene_type:complete